MSVNQSNPIPKASGLAPASGAPEGRLYLKEDELDRAVELVFAASRTFFKAAGGALAAHELGPAHYRALASIRREEGLSVSTLLARLGVRKQSLARVLGDLQKNGLVERRPGASDRRQRLLWLTESGRDAERAASAALRERLAHVFRQAGAEAVAGARQVLKALAAEDETR